MQIFLHFCAFFAYLFEPSEIRNNRLNIVILFLGGYIVLRQCEDSFMLLRVVTCGALSITPYTVHPTPYTLHLTPYTLHLTPYTLHHTPYTLHPTPYTLHLFPAPLPLPLRYPWTSFVLWYRCFANNGILRILRFFRILRKLRILRKMRSRVLFSCFRPSTFDFRLKIFQIFLHLCKKSSTFAAC